MEGNRHTDSVETAKDGFRRFKSWSRGCDKEKCGSFGVAVRLNRSTPVGPDVTQVSLTNSHTMTPFDAPGKQAF